MELKAYIDEKQIQKRKDNLKRGQTKAFKQALGETVHWWRENLAPKHFKPIAHQIYGHPKSKYSQSEAKSSTNGATITQNGRTLTPPYSLKKVMQVRNNYDPQEGPIVYSGDTRVGILQGQFTVTGSAKRVRGSWNSDKISWRGLAKDNNKLGRKLLFTPQQEQKQMLSKLDNVFLPKYIEKLDNNEELPSRLRMTRAGGGTFSNG